LFVVVIIGPHCLLSLLRLIFKAYKIPHSFHYSLSYVPDVRVGAESIQ